MSKTIDPNTPLSELDEDDLLYLHQRSRITDAELAQALDQDGADEDAVAEAMKQFSQAPDPANLANTGDANTAGLDQEALARKVQRMAKEQDARSATPADELDEDDEDDDLDDVPYTDKRWTNDKLREELAGRNLSTEGNKQELIARLEKDDEE